MSIIFVGALPRQCVAFVGVLPHLGGAPSSAQWVPFVCTLAPLHAVFVGTQAHPQAGVQHSLHITLVGDAYATASKLGNVVASTFDVSM
ncbi:hypothetical protein DFH06DRAFT_1328899 [Mycena polygramma]|nr:hypothetical protein DFH06DRAFT_1328899 [Mycena polygramma]